MKNKHWFLPLVIIVLLLSCTVGCGQPGFTKYTNETEGYTISHPSSWKVEVSEDGTICLITGPSRMASIMIYVLDSMPAQAAAQYWLMSLGTQWHEVTLVENKSMEGFWNWYLAYDYETDIGPYHGEAYFKSTPEHLYRLDTAGDEAGYDSYPFSSIISSFKLK